MEKKEKGSLSTLTGMEINDKNLVILCATILAVVCVITLGADALGVVGNALTGMFGVAVGKALNK
jgi:hypothetical protein